VESFDAQAGAGVIELAQECGIITNSSSSASSSSASASAASASSTATSKSGAAGADETLWKMSFPGLMVVMAIGLILM
jgi:hypothetical protein